MATTTLTIELERLSKGMNNARLKFAHELRRISDPYTPRDTGTLIATSTVADDGSWIQYNQEYARRLWYGDGFNFQGSPTRGSRWVQRAENVNKDHLDKFLLKVIKQG